MFNKSSKDKNRFMLTGSFSKHGYDWWWHSFTALDEFNNEVPFFMEFFITNPKIEGDLDLGLVSKKPKFLMIKIGHWGKDKIELNKFIDLNCVKIGYDVPFEVESKFGTLSETKSTGSFVIDETDLGYKNGFSDLGSVSWNLDIKKEVPFNVGYGTSRFLRFIKAFQMYWHAEGMKSSYSGEIIINDKKYTILPEKSYGYADKNWGRGFTSPWVWLSSNNIHSNLYNKDYKNSVFDIGGGCPKVYNIRLNRKLLSAFFIEGKRYEFNFSKVHTLVKTKFKCIETDDKIIWNVSQENRKYKYYLEASCLKEDMIHVHYIDPSGIKRFSKLWNGGNGVANIKIYKKGKKYRLIDDLTAKNLGCEYGEFDKN